MMKIGKSQLSTATWLEDDLNPTRGNADWRMPRQHWRHRAPRIR